MATGSDGNVWFGNNDGGLLRVSMTGAMKLVPLPYDCGESSPCAFTPGTGMAVSSDGKFYLGGANINAARTLETIGVVTTAGKLTLHDLPSGDVIANATMSTSCSARTSTSTTSAGIRCSRTADRCRPSETRGPLRPARIRVLEDDDRR